MTIAKIDELITISTKIIQDLIRQCHQVSHRHELNAIGRDIFNAIVDYVNKNECPNVMVTCLVQCYFDTLSQTKTDDPSLQAAALAHGFERLLREATIKAEALKAQGD